MRQAQVQVAGSGAGADDCQAHLPAAVVDLDARPQVAAVVAQGADESVHAVVVQGAAAVGGGHLRAGRQAGRQAEGREGRRVRVRRCSRMQSAGQKAPAPLPVSSAPVPALTAVPPAQLHCSSTRLEAGKHCGHLAVLCGIADPPLDSAVIRGVDDPLISVHI